MEQVADWTESELEVLRDGAKLMAAHLDQAGAAMAEAGRTAESMTAWAASKGTEVRRFQGQIQEAIDRRAALKPPEPERQGEAAQQTSLREGIETLLSIERYRPDVAARHSVMGLSQYLEHRTLEDWHFEQLQPGAYGVQLFMPEREDACVEYFQVIERDEAVLRKWHIDPLSAAWDLNLVVAIKDMGPHPPHADPVAVVALYDAQPLTSEQFAACQNGGFPHRLSDFVRALAAAHQCPSAKSEPV